MVGRPTSYRPEYVEQAEKLCHLGATDIEVADFFGIDVRTLYRWKIAHPKFCQALKAGKETADARVERSLYAKATGYTYEAVKIFQYEGSPVVVPYREHVPPDTTAAIFWLKNRRPTEWRDRVLNEHSGVDGAPLVVEIVKFGEDQAPK
jgi:hypothetical protein